MKLIHLTTTLALLFLLSTASAAFCDELDPDRAFVGCECREITEVDNTGRPVDWIDVPDVVEGSDWMNTYCLGGLEGAIRQRRTVFKIDKPECVERTEETEYRDAVNELCKSCPAPALLTGWKARECAGTKTVYQRDVIASYFTPEVTECEQARFLELEARQAGPCAGMLGAQVLWLSNNAVTVAALIFIAIATTAIAIKWRKK